MLFKHQHSIFLLVILKLIVDIAISTSSCTTLIESFGNLSSSRISNCFKPCVVNLMWTNLTAVYQDLEHNLADVMRQSFKQCWDTRAKLRLLEVFEGISGRELVQVRPLRPADTNCEL